MSTPELPQSTIEYLNKGAPAGKRSESLQEAALHYLEAGFHEAVAEEDLIPRAEEDGLALRDAESIIRRVFQAAQGPDGLSLPPRVEKFQAKRNNRRQESGRTAETVMRGRSIPDALPAPLEDPCRTFLRVAFQQDEYIFFSGKESEEDDLSKVEGRSMSYLAAMNLLDIEEGDACAIPGTWGYGAFVGMNPLRSQESVRKNSEITELRHVLVEFDELSKEEQWLLLQSSRLPLTAIIDSGGRSLHGWVRVDAENIKQFQHATAEVYAFFDGYPIDTQNGNATRLSRLPGALRGESKQELLAINMGLPSFDAWRRWRTKEPEIMSWDEIDSAEIKMPELLIDNMLHRGNKMTLGGGSKSMKSWALADLAVSVATGQRWWGNNTVKGRVLVIDFELQRYFWRERVRSVVEAKGGEKPHNLDVLSMRGRMADFEMVRRYVMEACDQREYSLIILDPIYKCLGGRDENLAGDVASLMNEVEALTLDTGAAVVIAAHYSKGNQAAKDSLDRISGSGVFARDPDAILAMTKHEDEGSFTVDVTVRNFEPVKPFVVSWRWPLMHRNTELDPDNIKMPANERARQPKITVAAFLRELKGVKPMTKDELKDKTMAAFGIGKSKFYEVFKEAEKSGKLVCVCGLYRVREEEDQP